MIHRAPIAGCCIRRGIKLPNVYVYPVFPPKTFHKESEQPLSNSETRIPSTLRSQMTLIHRWWSKHIHNKYTIQDGGQTTFKHNQKLECGPMPNVMVALPNIGGALGNDLLSADVAPQIVACRDH